VFVFLNENYGFLLLVDFSSKKKAQRAIRSALEQALSVLPDEHRAHWAHWGLVF
jgi:hypothetical protein